jgi:hypothetical protein
MALSGLETVVFSVEAYTYALKPYRTIYLIRCYEYLIYRIVSIPIPF